MRSLLAPSFADGYHLFFFLMLRQPPTSTLFPYTTLFRFIAASLATRWIGAILFGLLADRYGRRIPLRSEEHTSELQSRFDLVCRLLLEKKKSIGSANQRAPAPIQVRVQTVPGTQLCCRLS